MRGGRRGGLPRRRRDGVCDRAFRRCMLCRYEEGAVEGLADKRLNQVSHRRAPVDEVMALEATIPGPLSWLECPALSLMVYWAAFAATPM
jgi:hypothetical protein